MMAAPHLVDVGLEVLAGFVAAGMMAAALLGPSAGARARARMHASARPGARRRTEAPR